MSPEDGGIIPGIGILNADTLKLIKRITVSTESFAGKRKQSNYRIASRKHEMSVTVGGDIMRPLLAASSVNSNQICQIVSDSLHLPQGMASAITIRHTINIAMIQLSDEVSR